MSTQRLIVCILVMALVTYIPRVLPVTVFRKQIKSGLYTLCRAGSPDLSGCTVCYRKLYFCSSRDDCGNDPGIFQAKPSGGGCCSHWRCISGGNTILIADSQMFEKIYFI